MIQIAWLPCRWNPSLVIVNELDVSNFTVIVFDLKSTVEIVTVAIVRTYLSMNATGTRLLQVFLNVTQKHLNQVWKYLWFELNDFKRTVFLFVF